MAEGGAHDECDEDGASMRAGAVDERLAVFVLTESGRLGKKVAAG